MQAAIISMPNRVTFGQSDLMRARKEAATTVLFSEETYPVGHEFRSFTTWKGTDGNVWNTDICMIANDVKVLGALSIQFDGNANITQVIIKNDDGQVHYSKGHH